MAHRSLSLSHTQHYVYSRIIVNHLIFVARLHFVLLCLNVIYSICIHIICKSFFVSFFAPNDFESLAWTGYTNMGVICDL